MKFHDWLLEDFMVSVEAVEVEYQGGLEVSLDWVLIKSEITG